MKTLVVFFSSTGRTQAHMLRLMEALGGEQLITIRARRPYTGPFGLCRALREVFSGRDAALCEPGTPLDMSAYDLVVLGTPVWAGKIASPLRTFLKKYGKGIRRCAYVITHSGPEAYEKVLDELDALTGVRRVAALSLSRFDKDVEDKYEAFVKAVLEMPS